MSATFDEAQRPRLKKLFWVALTYLIVLIGLSLYLTIRLVHPPLPDYLILISLTAGVVGSGTAALVSCLDRHAAGFADKDGNATPEPEAKRERFTEGMFYWFLLRPWLGAVVAALVYWGMTSEFFRKSHMPTSAAGQGETVAFYGLLAGVFAKTVLDILRGLLKNIFKQ